MVAPVHFAWSGIVAFQWMTQMGGPDGWSSQWTAPSANLLPFGVSYSIQNSDWTLWNANQERLKLEVLDARANLNQGEMLILRTAKTGDVLWRVNFESGTVYSPEFGSMQIDQFVKRINH